MRRALSGLCLFAAAWIAAAWLVGVDPGLGQGSPPIDRVGPDRRVQPELKRRPIDDRRARLPMCSPASINLDAPNGDRCVRWGNPKRLEKQAGPGAPCYLTVNQCIAHRVGNTIIYY